MPHSSYVNINQSNESQKVVAKYNFEGRNNDELSFKKNDVITVIQQLQEGWWEGTTKDGRIGWFPSNYVFIPTTKIDLSENKQLNSKDSTFNYPEKRSEIFISFLARENEHLKMLDMLCREIFPDLQRIVMDGRSEKLHQALSDISKFTQNLLKELESDSKKSLNQQFTGRIFMNCAQSFFDLLKHYCEIHALAIEFFNTNSQKISPFLESKNLPLNELIVKMGVVYRHVIIYSAFLQELETNTPETHPDRGNIQRACVVYRDFYTFCEEIRRQKESQQDFIASGAIQENFSANFTERLGAFLHLGKVTIPDSSEADKSSTGNVNIDRCLAIFQFYTLIFEQIASENRIAYVLRKSTPNKNLSIGKCVSNYSFKLNHDGRSFEIRALTKDDFKNIAQAFKKCVNSITVERSPPLLNKNHRNYTTNNTNERIDAASSAEQHNSEAPKHPNATSMNRRAGMFRLNHDLEMILPESTPSTDYNQQNKKLPLAGEKEDTMLKSRGKLYSGWCLRAEPPAISQFTLSNSATAKPIIKMRKENVCLDEFAEDDALMLKIVEGYWASANPTTMSSARHYRHSDDDNHFRCCSSPHNHHHGAVMERHSDEEAFYGAGARASSYPPLQEYHSRPQLIVAENEKLLVEEFENGELVMKERTLVDTVYSLRDQLTSVQKEFSILQKTLESEQKARRRLEEQIRQNLGISNLNTTSTSNLLKKHSLPTSSQTNHNAMNGEATENSLSNKNGE